MLLASASMHQIHRSELSRHLLHTVGSSNLGEAFLLSTGVCHGDSAPNVCCLLSVSLEDCVQIFEDPCIRCLRFVSLHNLEHILLFLMLLGSCFCDCCCHWLVFQLRDSISSRVFSGLAHAYILLRIQHNDVFVLGPGTLSCTVRAPSSSRILLLSRCSRLVQGGVHGSIPAQHTHCI